MIRVRISESICVRMDGARDRIVVIWYGGGEGGEGGAVGCGGRVAGSVSLLFYQDLKRYYLEFCNVPRRR